MSFLCVFAKLINLLLLYFLHTLELRFPKFSLLIFISNRIVVKNNQMLHSSFVIVRLVFFEIDAKGLLNSICLCSNRRVLLLVFLK
jgi:hypothetical protein